MSHGHFVPEAGQGVLGLLDPVLHIGPAIVDLRFFNIFAS